MNHEIRGTALLFDPATAMGLSGRLAFIHHDTDAPSVTVEISADMAAAPQTLVFSDPAAVEAITTVMRVIRETHTPIEIPLPVG